MVASPLAHSKTLVLDMDGTIYLGDSLFPFTPDFLKALEQSGRNFYFFTNNSSKNREAYLQKLKGMGISCTPEQMCIANDVLFQWLHAHHPGKSCYVVGTPLLLQDFQDHGIALDESHPDFVVLGFDTTLTYEKLVKACDFVRKGVPLLGVNPDWNCPVEQGFVPDCGSIAALVKAATGADCTFFGKPSPHTLDYLLHHTGRAPEELAIIGDRLYTDIAVAQGSGVTSVLVLSGETDEKMLAESPIRPDLVVSDLRDLIPLL